MRPTRWRIDPLAKAPRFDAAWQRRRRLGATWRRWRWAVYAVLLLSLWAAARLSGIGEPEWQPMERQFTVCGQGSSFACVVDGDTIRLGERRIRLTGFDAPELSGACEAERQLARVARDELAAWLNLGAFEMEGGDKAPRDQYGRELRALRRGSELLADIMTQRGLARRSGFARDWCD